MRLVTFYLHSPSSADAQPIVPISGEFKDISEAREIAIATATGNPRFASWCVGFEIENDAGEIVSSWTKDAHVQRP
jgi:hypothetical protein